MLAIATQGLTKYYGQSRGIVDVSLEVNEGEAFGFVGPNGAGKTTTIRSLLGLLRPSSGWARIFDVPVPVSGGRIFAHVGYVPGDVRYYPGLTGSELLDYAASFHPKSDPNWRKSLVQRLQFDPSRRIRTYSHGNLKKLGIIQALLHRPRLLILDEPTNGLDPLVRLELFSLLKELNREGTTILFSTHVLEEVDRVCSQVGVIREGRLVEVGAVDRLPGREMKIITLKLKDESPPRGGPGWGEPEPVEGKPGQFRVAVEAPANEVVATLAGWNIEYLKITDPSIEELFLAIYEPQAGGGGHG